MQIKKITVGSSRSGQTSLQVMKCQVSHAALCAKCILFCPQKWQNDKSVSSKCIVSQVLQINMEMIW